MDKLTILKYILVGVLLIIAMLSLISGNAIIGFVAIMAVVLFIYLNFLKPHFQKEPIDKRELIDLLLTSLDYDYKQPVRDDNFELFADMVHGDDEHKFVFIQKDDNSVLWYYPCTINIYTGKITSMTGTRTDKISNAEFFLYGERKPAQRPKIDQELIDELIEVQKEQIRDEVNRAKGADMRDD